MATRTYKASDITGKHIYQSNNRTIYSDYFMKDFGYVITDDEAEHYHSYSLRLFESILAFALLLFVTNSNVLLSFGISILAYVVISLLFYFKFLKKLPKIENFKKEKKDNYIVANAKDMSKARLLVLSIILVVTTICVIYYPIYNNYDGAVKILLFCIGIATGIFTLMNIASLIYKIIKKA